MRVKASAKDGSLRVQATAGMHVVTLGINMDEKDIEVFLDMRQNPTHYSDPERRQPSMHGKNGKTCHGLSLINSNHYYLCLQKKYDVGNFLAVDTTVTRPGQRRLRKSDSRERGVLPRFGYGDGDPSVARTESQSPLNALGRTLCGARKSPRSP
ncbi:hypothetical protein [Bradyrhizobium cytisi]|uniref:hypothetical protein n=1 Tax=Bradyrhizobium cytisi TaxID=515489 RepID=UPI0016530171|nr:hypothetical protein [Bradyrhizobium cytisi]